MATHRELNQRRDYGSAHLDEESVDVSPFTQFDQWLSTALACDDIDEAIAMTLATATADARPSARVVLLRGFDENGFVFFTNYESRKGSELEDNPRAALLFYWGPLERQVRIEGTVEKVTDGQSDDYWNSRPRGSRLASLASEQSTETTKSAFSERLEHLEARFTDDVPRPPHWGGYRVVAERFEFWQGGTNRMHDRICYLKRRDRWKIARLSP